MQPLVSVLIPCYNAAPWVAQSIQSALDQTYPYKEVVVVDDGSKDNSLAIIRAFGDRIRVETGPNRGGNAARNRLVHLSQGSWLSFLDADDFLLPQKIERQVAFLATRPSLEIVYSPAMWVSQDSEAARAYSVIDDDLYANYFRWSIFSTNSPLWKKSAVQEVGGWKEDQAVCQEHELILRLILAGKQFALMPQALVVNRLISNDSVSRRSPMKTLMQKMQLSELFEAHLRARGEMNETRKLALAQARFEAARTAYHWDKQYAKAMMKQARDGASLSELIGINTYYRWAMQLVGFDLAERIASLRRRLFPKTFTDTRGL